MADFNDNALQRYLREVGANRILTDEEDASLAEAIGQGDSRAVQKLVESNLKYVISLAHQHAGRGVGLDDLIAEGNIGMMEAASHFDGSRGVRFVVYAAPYIRQAMEKAIKEQEARLYARGTGMEGGQGQKVAPVSIDAPIPAGSQNNLTLAHVLENADAIRADIPVEWREAEEAMERLVACLDEREAPIVRAILGIGRPVATLGEIGVEMGLKRERVRQIRDKAFRKLRKLIRRQSPQGIPAAR